jgi:hypothetical protein
MIDCGLRKKNPAEQQRCLLKIHRIDDEPGGCTYSDMPIPAGAPRIYADFNGLCRPDRTGGRLAVALDTLGTVRDLTNVGLRLVEGLRLTVYDWSDEEEDLEADATVRYDPEGGLWWAELGPSGYAYVPKRDRTADPRFLCLGCRFNLAFDPGASAGRAPRATACPRCGTAVAAAIAPPAA